MFFDHGIIITALFHEGFKTNNLVTCYFQCGLPFTHIHNVHNLQTFSLSYTHSSTYTMYTQNKCSEYWKFIILSDLIFFLDTILCSYIYTMSVYLVIFPFGCFFYSFDNLTLHYETNCMHTLNIRMSHVYVFVISNKLFGN